ncbi:N-acetylmuramoyl-L-alanine amidase [Flavobacteriaceae bacterium F89]|uniref:N-acetylmuramoyl-L-alanine amidase n=1 Tax=Cerina litoralis TaxID=2874477 RepID=A0AAE3JRF8_9FLAO|nr:N-acetylmuramoyl-L-alanine amidase [Cerina litoralis]MCG2462854.1 N-acetylmuramoyl-L-alanine amidase [Cerina litoralis]
MKKVLKNISFLILLLRICPIFGQDVDTRKVVVIDPGHGGKDFGAVGENGIMEKEVALEVAKQILILNNTLFDNEIDIYLTRYGDTLISLKDRSRLAKTVMADVYMSLHCNASPSFSNGIEVYVHNSKTGKSQVKKSIAVGLSVLNESTGNLGFKRRGIRFANFQVLRETVIFCPAVLIEMGFVTNVDEADYFLEPKNNSAMALAILIGLYNYLNVI